MRRDELEIVSDAIVGLEKLIDAERVQKYFDRSLLDRLAFFAKNLKDETPILSLAYIFSYVSYEDFLMPEMVKSGILSTLFTWLSNPESPKNLKKEVLWMLANFLVGSDTFFDSVLGTPEQYQLIFSFCFCED